MCLNGFNGANCTINIDDCLSDPCKHNGTCTDLVNDYQCGCVAGFNGRTCENNINDCLPNHCLNNGTCTDLVNDYHCDCVAGFNGTNCENNIDECAVQPCQNNGTCIDLINDYQCICIDGFDGKKCTNNIDECLPDPCHNNGTCIDLVNDYHCHCVTGFNGTNCENNIDDCMPNPCQNNGTCTDLVNDYRCDCVAGFNRTNCENNIDECAVLPCQNNGTCLDLINDYQVICIDGFNWKNCTNNIDDCMSDPCQNNATCSDLVNDYHCDCVAGFNGTNCENNIDECAEQPCQNNGTCIDLINDYQCICIDGFNGKNCKNNIDDCLPDPCENNGTCTDLVNDYQCNCMLGFNETNCENNIDECEVQPCQNNGTCIDLINEYQCHCTDGYNGTNCTTDIDECATQPCQNNGSCLDIVNGYRCFCTNGFTGKNCANDTYILQVLNFESSSSVLHEGKSVWFKLELRSKTMYEFHWFHTGYLIANPSRRYKVTSLETENNTSIHTLHIANVLQRDMGTWKISVSNIVTNASRNLTLKVIPKLMLKMNPEYDFSILRGEEISLQCTVTNPEALLDVTNGSLVMTKDGSALPDVDISNFSTTWKKYAGMEVDSGRYTCRHSGYYVPVNVSVFVTVIQPEQKRCESEWSEGVLWNATLAGTTKQEPCPSKQKGTATRYCEPLGIWASPSLINCTTEAFTNASLQLDSLMEDGIQNTDKVQETVNNTLQMMKNLTSSTNELSAGDLSSSLDILEKIVDISNSTGSTIEKEVFYAVIDNVLSVNNSKSWTTVSEKTQKDASSILKNMERLSEVVIRSDNITATQFRGSNFELTINQTKIDESGLRFPDVSTNNLSGSSEQTPTYFVLPKQDSKTEKAINYVAVIYKTMSNILPSDSDSSDQIRRDLDQTSTKEEFVNSPILSLTTQNDLGVLIPPLNLTFGHVYINESSNMQAVCVSWDFTKNKWTERGCKMNQSDNKRTVCQCNHLTNFAILMRPYSPATEDKQSLKTMSLVGVILSIFFTALTCVIYTMTWRYIKSDQNILLLNLCGSLILSYVIFISAVEQTGNEGACIAITAIIHYLFLVTFFCMLGMGVYYFMSITVTYYAMYVANNFKSISRVHWFLLTIYGLPVIITTTTLGAFWGKDYHLKYYCWLSPKSGSLYLFIIPVCLISMLNLLIIVSLVRVLSASSAMMKSSLQKKATSGLRSLGTLLPVLGVTWLFGILAVNEKADVFQYIFVIANSLQGFFIFVSHVLLNKKVMQGLKNRYPVLTTLISITEHSKTETTSVSHSQSSSKSNALLFTMKKKGIFERLRNKTVKKSDSVVTEKTTSTACCSSVSHEKSLVMSEYESTNNTLKLISEEENTRGRFWFSFSLNPWKKKYTVTEM
nr:adhesion G protein-coupled receptor E1 isoform X4 [Crassostrea gigas]